jgi:hypothetical protein
VRGRVECRFGKCVPRKYSPWPEVILCGSRVWRRGSGVYTLNNRARALARKESGIKTRRLKGVGGAERGRQRLPLSWKDNGFLCLCLRCPGSYAVNPHAQAVHAHTNTHTGMLVRLRLGRWRLAQERKGARANKQGDGARGDATPGTGTLSALKHSSEEVRDGQGAAAACGEGPRWLVRPLGREEEDLKKMMEGLRQELEVGG